MHQLSETLHRFMWHAISLIAMTRCWDDASTVYWDAAPIVCWDAAPAKRDAASLYVTCDILDRWHAAETMHQQFAAGTMHQSAEAEEKINNKIYKPNGNETKTKVVFVWCNRHVSTRPFAMIKLGYGGDEGNLWVGGDILDLRHNLKPIIERHRPHETRCWQRRPHKAF